MKRGARDDGFTLPELLISALLIPLVLLIVGSFVVSATRSNTTVSSQTATASAAQAVARSITSSTRQSTWMSVTSTGSGQLLKVLTASSDSSLTWSCRAWWFDGAALWQKSATSAITAPTTPATQGWTLVASGVAANGSTPVFVSAAGLLTVSFTATASGQTPLLVTTSVAPRQTSAGGGTCS